MEELHLLKENVKQGNDQSKLDPKKVYFCVPLNKQSRKYVRFKSEGSIYEYLCLCFGFSPALKIVYKNNHKVPASILCKMYIRIIV